MSQVVVCARCGLASELKCDLCPNTLPLCRPCAVPHYRLFHDLDFHTRTPLPPLQPVERTQSVNLMPIPAIKVLKKKVKMKSSQKLVTDYIRRKLKT